MAAEHLEDELVEGVETAREPVPENEHHDKENRLKPEFLRNVLDALDDDEFDRVYDLVEPLHAADIADLLELIDEEQRVPLARAIRDLMGVDVIAELNDWVRESLIEGLPAADVADIAEQLETDDAVAML